MSELAELITKWESFKQEQPKGTLHDFAKWLNGENKVLKKAAKAETFSALDPEFEQYADLQKTTMQAGYLIGKLYQYLLVYTKPVMKKYGLHSMDDFGYLATVNWHHTISKSKACAAMLHEVTTGVDIIKRLVHLGYIKEIGDKTDRRQKLLQLTAKGKKVLQSLKTDFKELPDVLGELELEERKKLVLWLITLDQYHEKILKEQK